MAPQILLLLVMHVSSYLECSSSFPLVSLFLSLFSAPQCSPSLVRLPMLSEGTFNSFAAVPHPLMYFPKCATQRPLHLSAAHIIVFGPALENTYPSCLLHVLPLLANTMEAIGSDGGKPLPHSTHHLSHLGLM